MEFIAHLMDEEQACSDVLSRCTFLLSYPGCIVGKKVVLILIIIYNSQLLEQLGKANVFHF